MLVYSKRWTLFNLAITLAGLTFGGGILNVEYANRPDIGCYKSVLGLCIPYHTLIFVCVAVPLMIFAIVNYAILMIVKSCPCTCCFGAPFIKRSGLDIETLEVLFLEEIQAVSAIEMKPLKNGCRRRISYP